MSQPQDRGARIAPPGKVDRTLGEFWVENPWEIAASGHNLSCFERKRVYLNVADQGGRNFLEISHLTGADSDGDGRCVIAGDLRNNGQQDLILRQVGGGPLVIFENKFPKKHYLEVSLRGTQSNRLGIGARLIAFSGGRQIVREQFPHNSFRSQMPTIVHFGLAEATRVERLVIKWPSGKEQVLENLPADQHVIIDEGKEGPAAVETVVPGQQMRP